VQQKKNSR